MPDKYANYETLSENEKNGRDFQVRLSTEGRSTTIVIAPHGGSIEPGTSELAFAIAGQDIFAGAFEGMKARGNGDLHITSTQFDEPSILKMVASADNVLALHGESSNSHSVFIGGRDLELAVHIEASLTDSGFSVLRHPSVGLQSKSQENICNRGIRGAGVQLELARGLRQSFFRNLRRSGRQQRTEAFNTFVETVRNGLSIGGAL